MKGNDGSVDALVDLLGVYGRAESPKCSMSATSWFFDF